MAYVSNQEKTDRRYMTLPQAVEYVCCAEKWEAPKAQQNIVTAIAKKAVHVIYKNNDQGLLDHFPPKLHAAIRHECNNQKPVFGDKFIEQAKTINWQEGTILDGSFLKDENAPDHPTSLPRVLLLLRQDVEKWWQAAEKRGATKKGGNGGRPSVKDKVLDVLNRLNPDDPLLQKSLTEIAVYVAKKCGKAIGDKGWNVRTINNHISKWKK